MPTTHISHFNNRTFFLDHRWDSSESNYISIDIILITTYFGIEQQLYASFFSKRDCKIH